MSLDIPPVFSLAQALTQHANGSHSVQGLLAVSMPRPVISRLAPRDEPARCWSAPGGPIGILRITHLLPDQHPVTPPCRVLVVAVLPLVTRGCRGSGRTVRVDALGDAGPRVPARGFRPLRHCGREVYGRQQGRQPRQRAIRFSFQYPRYDLSVSSSRSTPLR